MSAYDDLTDQERALVDSFQRNLETMRDAEGVTLRYQTKIIAWLARLEKAKGTNRDYLLTEVEEIGKVL